MILADTSAWVDAFRRPDSDAGREIDYLLARQEIAITGVVLAEVLQGARGEPEFAQLRSWLQVLPYLEPTKETWIKAGALSMHLRAQGQLTPLTDLLIAALALEGGHEVYTLDEHFQRIPGLRQHQAAAR